jgi:hypothetical protein
MPRSKKKQMKGPAEVNASVPAVRTADLPALPDLAAPGAGTEDSSTPGPSEDGKETGPVEQNGKAALSETGYTEKKAAEDQQQPTAASPPERVPATEDTPSESEAQQPPSTSNREPASTAGGTPASQAQEEPPETDKAALSEDDLLASECDPVEEDADTPDPTFSALDEADFRRLDSEVTKASRRTFTALREIRQRKLYRLPKDEQGNKLYPTFEAYVQQRHGHTRVWVTQGTNWLRTLEALEQVGLPVPLTVDAAQGLRPHLIKDAGGLVAIFEEAQEDGVPLTKDNLRAIVERRANYFREGAKVAATSYADYKQDWTVAKTLGTGTWGIVTDARKLPGDFADNLIRLCTERKRTPRAEQLLEVATGKALEEIVARLGTLAQRQEDIDAKRDRLKTLKKEIKAIRGGMLGKLLEEAKAIEAEIKGGQANEGDEGGEDHDGEDEPTQAGPKLAEGDALPNALRLTFTVEGVVYDPGVTEDDFADKVRDGSLLIKGWPEWLIVTDDKDQEGHNITGIDWKLTEVEEDDEEEPGQKPDDEQTAADASGDFSDEALSQYEPEKVPEL